MGRYEEALEPFFVALEAFRKNNNQTLEGVALNNIGLVYRVQKRYADSLDYHQRALAIDQNEAQAVASLLGVPPFFGKNATESILQEQAANASILHLVAHGTYNSINPLYSTLYLASDYQEDGALEVHEIYSLDLSQSQLIGLRACESQLGELSRGDELLGLTRAFFFAGAPSVMASLWQVDDNSTQLLMEKFYTQWSEGMSQAKALQ